jgi:predicted glutamine amidotransferase
MIKILDALKTFIFGEKDFVKSTMREYGVKTKEELSIVLEKESLAKVNKIFNLETNSKYTILETKRVLNITYSDDKYNMAMRLIEKGEIHNVEKLDEESFVPTANYLTFYQITTEENKVFVMAVIYPYEPYQATESLWLYQLPRKLW